MKLKKLLNDYKKLAKEHRLVICLDTLELLQYESDPVQDICQVETIDALVMNWLIQQLPTLPNTVILMAGRSENRDRIESSFTKHFQTESTRFKAQPLDVFTADETEEYLFSIANKLEARGDNNLTEILSSHQEIPINVHRATGDDQFIWLY